MDRDRQQDIKKIKINRYRIHMKGRRYEILVFPFIKHMWPFDAHPSEKCLMVDGCKEAFSWMKYAFAILSNFPDKLIYFPCKQEGIGSYYGGSSYDLVLCRPELQFRRSLWAKIKKKLDRNHAVEKFVFAYNRKKLEDYFEKGLWKKYPVEEGVNEDRKNISYYIFQKADKTHVEEILGDTMFFVLNRIECFEWHYHTVKDLDKYGSGKDKYIWSSIGWIISDGNIHSMYQDAEQKALNEKYNKEQAEM